MRAEALPWPRDRDDQVLKCGRSRSMKLSAQSRDVFWRSNDKICFEKRKGGIPFLFRPLALATSL